MKKLIAIIEWVLSIENQAAALYAEIADRSREDPAFMDFIRGLADDEAWHVRVMQKALDLARAGELPPSELGLDEPLRRKIEDMLRSCRAILDRDGKPEPLLECIVDAEISEWNDIFVYIVNVLKERNGAFASVAAKIHQHKKHIERYLEGMPGGKAHLDRIRATPSVWREKILFAEDYPPIRTVFADILSQEAQVVIAENGKDALEKAMREHFDVIITDMNMPEMDGYEFIRRAARLDPKISDRTIFLIGNPHDDRVPDLKEQGYRIFIKPIVVTELEEAVREIIRRTRA